MASTILITGISASGKTTLGKRLQKNLLETGLNDVRLLDGEVIRETFKRRGKCYGYTTEE